jgi:hypothetical protein
VTDFSRNEAQAGQQGKLCKQGATMRPSLAEVPHAAMGVRAEWVMLNRERYIETIRWTISHIACKRTSGKSFLLRQLRCDGLTGGAFASQRYPSTCKILQLYRQQPFSVS